MDMKCSPRPRVGLGQGFERELATPQQVVRVRTGRQVGRGSYLGDQTQPYAFVWEEENAATPERELVVQAGRDGSYLWEKKTLVTLTGLFPKDRDLATLDNRLADWQRFFAKYYNPKMPQKFWWGKYNEEGRRLARQLQAALIDQAVVRYLRPREDPQSKVSPEIAL